MRVINDFAGLPSAPLADAEGTKETNLRPALYRPGVLFQPASQKLAVLDAPSPALNSSTPAGGIRPLATAAPEAASQPNVVRPFVFAPNSGPASGTATLSDIMSHLGKPTSQADIDQAIRRTSINLAFAPEDMIQFARENGLKAEG